MTPTEAAALWTRIERELVARGLLRESWELREQRAALVRLVGDERIADPPLGLSDEQRARFVVRETEELTDIIEKLPTRTLELVSRVQAGPSSPSDSDISRMLDKYIERSIKGYSDDDEVDYVRRR
jgi:hypothetical protein